MMTITKQELKKLADATLYQDLKETEYMTTKMKLAYNDGVMDLADDLAKKLGLE